MAKELKVLENLKDHFANYDAYVRCLSDLGVTIDKINKFNKDSAGTDTIGETYHQQVDEPTENLTETVKYVRQRLGLVTDAGKETSDVMNQADEDAGSQADGF
ncbi:hypothetical protein [Streptomyces sp. NPDC058872]|uniref:hypothetical protein n=1 Tax=Streptomyces sp. NPDC058872 TaxID=3346661 RepID=UPI0036BACAEE